jgi:hypothetical protein
MHPVEGERRFGERARIPEKADLLFIRYEKIDGR